MLLSRMRMNPFAKASWLDLSVNYKKKKKIWEKTWILTQPNPMHLRIVEIQIFLNIFFQRHSSDIDLTASENWESKKKKDSKIVFCLKQWQIISTLSIRVASWHSFRSIGTQSENNNLIETQKKKNWISVSDECKDISIIHSYKCGELFHCLCLYIGNNETFLPNLLCSWVRRFVELVFVAKFPNLTFLPSGFEEFQVIWWNCCFLPLLLLCLFEKCDKFN